MDRAEVVSHVDVGLTGGTDDGDVVEVRREIVEVEQSIRFPVVTSYSPIDPLEPTIQSRSPSSVVSTP
ncbi:hypothetical protein A6E15_11145 [Natrinema saccharevitans]|uniref:Uncharacterized protein n=1 Tax=Natrinema saccharevitans TaxID=301967 RepID=A0A1S8AYR1_9EURY|nr:hypothetical protein A6E15_11145 [Natrinema saccharevitans]